MEDKKPKKKQPRYIKLAGIGFQMGATIFLFSYLGKYLDKKYQVEESYWTMGLIILGVAISLYSLLKQVNRINNEEDNSN